jgi:transcriptional regulator with XRE-family HTH domain
MGMYTSREPMADRKQVLRPEQCRAARALLGWTQAQLAERTGLARKTIADFECNLRSFHFRTLRDITSAFQDAGIEFTWEDDPNEGEALGIRMVKRPVSSP